MAKSLAAMLAAMFSGLLPNHAKGLKVTGTSPVAAASASAKISVPSPIPPARPKVVRLSELRPFPPFRGLLVDDEIATIYLHAGNLLCLNGHSITARRCGLCLAKIPREVEGVVPVWSSRGEELLLLGALERSNPSPFYTAVKSLDRRRGVWVEFSFGGSGEIVFEAMTSSVCNVLPPTIGVAGHLLRWAQYETAIEARKVSPPEGGAA